MIRIDTQYLGLIGDALCGVPYILSLCEQHRSQACVTANFSPAVRPLLARLPIVFDEIAEPSTDSYPMALSDAWQKYFRSGFPWHMAQMYFAYYDRPVPPLPFTLDLCNEDCDLASGVVLTPFSRTNLPDNNKLWPHDRWRAVINRLQEYGLAQRFYVLGASYDNFAEYQGIHGVEPIIDRPLTQVLDLLRKSPLVLGLDNGISHLCHFGAIGRHVMIYADCLPPRLAENPRGVHLRGKRPESITVDQVVRAATDILVGAVAA